MANPAENTIPVTQPETNPAQEAYDFGYSQGATRLAADPVATVKAARSIGVSDARRDFVRSVRDSLTRR
jgi:hypothetical protein